MIELDENLLVVMNQFRRRDTVQCGPLARLGGAPLAQCLCTLYLQT